MLPLVCHVKYRLNGRATEILAHTVDSCFETTNTMCATSGEVGVEKYSGKVQFLLWDCWEEFTLSNCILFPLFSKGTL